MYSVYLLCVLHRRPKDLDAFAKDFFTTATLHDIVMKGQPWVTTAVHAKDAMNEVSIPIDGTTDAL